MGDQCTSKILDLSEVTLVGLEVVRFLIHCADEGIELVQYPPNVRGWMFRECTDVGQRENAQPRRCMTSPLFATCRGIIARNPT